MRINITITLLLLSLGLSHGQQPSDLSSETYFKAAKWRNIGPYRGGRSVTATGVVNDPLTYYMGTTGGGLWKTSDAGQIWSNISDGYFATGSVGAVAVSESQPNIVYCGMGEHAPRGVMTSYGDGVYKSTDAGKTWKKIGLDKTQHISRIVIHPHNPDIVYVAAQGALYGPNDERGIYKSMDGGETWSQILFVNNLTGCAELSMDMNNPQVLYAAMWEHQRKPWIVISGGSGSGLYKSTDAGKTWIKIHEGLPEEKGKMAISVSRANSDKVYALIESDSNAEKGGLFVSHNAGKNWSRVSDDHRLIQRAWYYIEVFADPVDENIVYVMSAPALRSIDGGKNWEVIDGPHGDYHDLWINPKNNKNMVIADDGGAGISFNNGATWSTQMNMPTAQFYRVATDNQYPYRIYGGQQDNTSVVIASIELGNDGIYEQSWTASAGGESAFLAFDPDDPRYVMGGSYLGTIDLLDAKASASTNVMAAPIQYLGMAARDMKYLFNWNAPIIQSQHEPNTFYHGAQYLLRTTDMGQSWEEVSPDLTRNQDDKQGKGGGPYTVEAVGAENYGTLSYVIESPHEKGVIWTGSDDGLVHITKDGGKSWTNVTPKRLTECLINAIDVSPHDPATAYIATTRYKFNDHTPALYKTTNYGKSWVNISNGIPMGAFTRVAREDKVRKDMLFAGTELGMYISWNGGQDWQTFQLNLPVTPITDLTISHDDIIVSTSGRSFWIFDDLGLLRDYAPLGSADVKLYKPENAYLANFYSELNGNSESFNGTHPRRGINPANGVVIYYHLPKIPDSVTVEMHIYNSNNQLVRSYKSKKSDSKSWDGGPSPDLALSKNEGLNRLLWDMRHAKMSGIPNVYIEGSYNGHKASPGNYTIELRAGDTEKRTEVSILNNPLYDISPEQYQEYDQFMTGMEANLNDMHNRVNSLYMLKNKIENILSDIKDTPAFEEVTIQGQALVTKISEWDQLMVQRLSKAYDDVENYPNKFTAEYLYLINQTESAIPRVNQPSKDLRIELDQKWNQYKTAADDILTKEIPSYNELLWKSGIGALYISK